MKFDRESPFLTGTPSLPERLILNGVREDIDAHVKTAALPDDDAESEDAFARRTVAEIDALAPHPIDGDVSIADRKLLADLDRHDKRVTEAERRAQNARAVLVEKNNMLISTPPCWSGVRLAALCFIYVAIAALVAIAVGLLLMTTLDDSFLANFFADKSDDPETVAMWAAFFDAAALIFGQCALQLFYVVMIRGDVPWWRKLGLLIFDLVFAVAWGLQRYADGGRLMAVSLTLIEFVAAAFFTWAVGALAEALIRNGARVEPYRDATAAVAVARKAVDETVKHLDQAERERYGLLEPLAARETAVRAAAARRTAAEETARVQYRVTTSELAAEATKNPTHDALEEGLDQHTSIFQARLDHKANGRKKS